MNKPELCNKCDCPLQDHQEERCLRVQLAQVQLDLRKLKVSLEEWKDSWFHLRSVIGELSWQHNHCPHEIKSAPVSEPNTWLHPNEKFVQQGKQVYARKTCGWRLIADGSSEEAAQAVVKLMTMEKTNE